MSDSPMRMRAKMDALEYLNALRSALSLADDMAEIPWMAAQEEQLRALYEEAKSILATMYM